MPNTAISQKTAVRQHRVWGPWEFYRRALLIGVPVMAQALIQSLVSLVDNFMVAGLGDVKMSGVNVAGQINFIFMVLVTTACGGAGIFMSQYNGAKDKNGMQEVFRYKLLLCVTGSFLYTLFCFASPRGVFALMVNGNSQAGEILAQTVRYERMQALSWLFFGISACFSSSLREIGKVEVPLVISICSTLVNTVGNYIFIYGHFGAPRLEVAGAALATVIARATECVAFVVYAMVKKPPFYSQLRYVFRLRPGMFSAILGKSLLVLVSDLSWVLTETITTALYNSRGGAEIVSGMSAGFTIANLFFTAFNGLFASIGVVLGGTLGSGDLDGARKQKNWLLSGSAVLGAVFGLMGVGTVFLIPIVYSNLSEASRAVARALVLLNSAYMIPWCFMNGEYAISRTGGDALMGAALDVVGNTFLTIPLMFALTYLTGLGPVAMYGIIKLIDFPKIAVGMVWLKSERWVRNLTVEQ